MIFFEKSGTFEQHFFFMKYSFFMYNTRRTHYDRIMIEHRLNILQDQEDLLTVSKMVSPPRTPEIHKENSLASPKENLRETSLQLTLEEGVGN